MKVEFNSINSFSLVAENQSEDVLLENIIQEGSGELFYIYPPILNSETVDPFRRITFQLQKGELSKVHEVYKKILRLIPGYSNAETSPYVSPKPSDVAENWIKKQLEPKKGLELLVSSTDSVYQIGNERKLRNPHQVSNNRLAHIDINRKEIMFPQGYKIKKIILEPMVESK